MKLSYSTWGMQKTPTDIAVQHCAAVGFDGVEWTVIPGWPADAAMLSTSERRRIRSLYDDSGIELCGMSGNVPLLLDDRAEIAVVVFGHDHPDDMRAIGPQHAGLPVHRIALLGRDSRHPLGGGGADLSLLPGAVQDRADRAGAGAGKLRQIVNRWASLEIRVIIGHRRLRPTQTRRHVDLDRKGSVEQHSYID